MCKQRERKEVEFAEGCLLRDYLKENAFCLFVMIGGKVGNLYWLRCLVKID